MLSKRHAEILRILDTEGTVTISALSDAMGVSAETVRRDVRPLVEGGSVLRMHGAISLLGQMGEAPFRRRMRENADAKQRIARAVAATIRNGDSLMLDTGTTTSFLARALTSHRGLTVVTNSTDIARILSPGEGNQVHLSGGRVSGDSGGVFGMQALRFVAGFSVMHSLISTSAIDGDEIMDHDSDEADFARAVLARGQRKLVVTDASKFGRRGLVTVCGFADVNEIFTDASPPAALSKRINAAGANVVLA